MILMEFLSSVVAAECNQDLASTQLALS